MNTSNAKVPDKKSYFEAGRFWKQQMPLILQIESFLIENSTNDMPMTLEAFSKRFGIPSARVSSILLGRAKAYAMDRDTVRKLAIALKISTFQFYSMSGLFNNEDVRIKEDMDQNLLPVYEKMRAHKVFCMMAPSRAEWDSWPTSAKISLSMAYQASISNRFARSIDQYIRDSQED